MKEINLNELKRIELELLIQIHDFCINNNLRYYLCGGTLLGAVRHHGFIPWDDDIDIHMPRPDYEYLIKNFIATDCITILSPGKKGYYYNFSKAVNPKTKILLNNVKQIDDYGVFIDIFPLDGLPLNHDKRIQHVKRLNSIRNRINTFCIDKPKFRKNPYKYFKSIYYYLANNRCDVIDFQNEYVKTALLYEYDVSEYVYATGGAYYSKEIYDKEIYNECESLEFEGHYFNAPKQWHLALTQIYGDYLILPPVEKQVSNHIIHAFYL